MSAPSIDPILVGQCEQNAADCHSLAVHYADLGREYEDDGEPRAARAAFEAEDMFRRAGDLFDRAGRYLSAGQDLPGNNLIDKAERAADKADDYVQENRAVLS